MKNVLVLLHSDRGLDARLNVALDLARGLGGQLICLDLTLRYVPALPEPIYMVELEPEVSPAVELEARRRIEENGVKFHWIERRGDLSMELTRVADLADFIVLSSANGLMIPMMEKAISDLLVKSGKIVIATPTIAAGMPLDAEAALLWDGSPGAYHAMTCAMPLFRHAKNVTILEIDDGSLGDSAVRASSHLSQHDIPNMVRSAPAFGERASDQLLEQLALVRPSYAVMGAFGTSRLIEKLFGGVTERMLHHTTVPLLLAR